MADDVLLNAGSGGETIATDQAAGGEHYQVVKLADGTADSTTHIPLSGDLTNGLDVDVTRVGGTVAVTQSGTWNVGTVTAVTDITNTVTVDNGGTFAVQAAQSGSWTATVDGGSTPTDNYATPTDAVNVASINMVYDGANWDFARGDATNGLLVNLGSNNDVTVTSGTVAATQSGTWNITNVSGTVSLPTNASTAANQSTIIGHVDGIEALLTTIDSDTSTLATTGNGTATGALRVTVASDSTGSLAVDLGSNNDVTVTGGNAHDGTTLGNPVLGGARATNSVEGITQVANADLTHVQSDLNGVLLSRPHTTLEEVISERVSNTNGTSTAFTNFGAGGAGIHNYVTTISIYNSSATDGYVDFRDGTTGSIIFTAAAPAAGGSVINLPVPLKGADNTALAYDVSGALSTVYISVVGFQAQG